MTDEQITLTFFTGRDGKTIARTSEGKICLLDIPYCKQNHIWVNPGEDWRCAVKEVRQNVVIIQPITKTLSAEENEKILEAKAKEFQRQGFAHKEGFSQKKPKLSGPSLVTYKKKAPAEGNLKPSLNAGAKPEKNSVHSKDKK